MVIENKEENDAILDELGKNKYIIEDIQNKKMLAKKADRLWESLFCLLRKTL